jgi:hypothetical protein
VDDQLVRIDEKNWFGHEAFAHSGSVYAVADIRSLRYEAANSTYNFIPMSHGATMWFVLSDGDELRFNYTSTLVAGRKVKNTAEAFNYIAQRTFQQRLRKYVLLLETQGWFEYHGCRITAEGDVVRGKTRINLADAALAGRVELGRYSWTPRFQYYTPDEFWAYEPGKKWFPKSVRVDLKEDRDAVLAIVSHFCESKGGKITVVKPK